MVMSRFHRRLLACLCAGLMLFAAIAPTISQAMSVARGADSGLTPICTHSGLQWVDAATGEARQAPADSGLSTHMERCPFCATQPPALPGYQRGTFVVPAPLAEELPFLFSHAPRPLAIWSRALTRAPPLI